MRSPRSRTAPEVVLQCVASEEDGGLGTFAALERDAAFDAALIPEPTGFDVVCAQAGALTFRLVVPGRAAHAATRLQGCSAIDRYVRIHAALHALEAELNAGVDHPLMRELELPYPVLVGQVHGGDWSSSVPDRVEAEGRVGVPIGADAAGIRAALEAAVVLDDGEAPVEVSWTGGAFLPGETPREDPWTERVVAAVTAERGADAHDRRALRRRHAPVHRPRDPVRDGRHRRARARARGRRVGGDRRARVARPRDRARAQRRRLTAASPAPAAAAPAASANPAAGL